MTTDERAGEKYDCPECDGSGYVDYDPGRMSFEACGKCDGTGEDAEARERALYARISHLESEVKRLQQWCEHLSQGVNLSML